MAILAYLSAILLSSIAKSPGIHIRALFCFFFLFCRDSFKLIMNEVSVNGALAKIIFNAVYSAQLVTEYNVIRVFFVNYY